MCSVCKEHRKLKFVQNLRLIEEKFTCREKKNISSILKNRLRNIIFCLFQPNQNICVQVISLIAIKMDLFVLNPPSCVTREWTVKTMLMRRTRFVKVRIHVFSITFKNLVDTSFLLTLMYRYHLEKTIHIAF